MNPVFIPLISLGFAGLVILPLWPVILVLLVAGLIIYFFVKKSNKLVERLRVKLEEKFGEE